MTAMVFISYEVLLVFELLDKSTCCIADILFFNNKVTYGHY